MRGGQLGQRKADAPGRRLSFMPRVRRLLQRAGLSGDEVVNIGVVCGMGFKAGGKLRGGFPVVIKQPVVGNAKNPGRESGQRLVVGPGVDDLDPDVLIELFGNGRVAALVRQVAMQRATIATIKGFKAFASPSR